MCGSRGYYVKFRWVHTSPTSPFAFQWRSHLASSAFLRFPAYQTSSCIGQLLTTFTGELAKYQQPHVYYRRADFHKAAAAAQQGAEQEMQQIAADYRFTSLRSFLNWLNYTQYRKLLILKPSPFIVIGDITNFFNSVLHSEVSNAFRDFPIASQELDYQSKNLSVREP
jgi:hypothetical protein